MKKWKRINNSDRKKMLKNNNFRIIMSGFMDEEVKAKRAGKRKIVTVVKI